MTIDINEFKSYLKIDKARLDDELVHQAELYYAVSEAHANAVGKRDTAKESMAAIDAELDAEIRANGDKLTEAQVKSKVQAHDEHKQIADDWLLAKAEAEKLAALKEAFQQRGYLIRDLCQLYINNYYSEQAVKHDADTDRLIYRQRRERIQLARTDK